jgi:hypothetical protein
MSFQERIPEPYLFHFLVFRLLGDFELVALHLPLSLHETRTASLFEWCRP